MDRSRITLIFTLLNLISLATLAELCPRECSCESSTKTVKCRNQGANRINIDGTTRTLDLSGNRMTSCHLLSEYRHLERVILSENLLKNVSRACFHEAVTLELLDLSYNRLAALPNMTGGPVIHTLNLTGNRIVELKPIGWYGLRYLTELVLDNNGLSTFSGGELLQETDALEVLALRNNKIKRFCANNTQHLFFSAANLRELYISNNTILELNTSWLLGAPKLEVLDLRSAYCSVDYTQDYGWEFPGHITGLKHLDLSHNKLHSFGRWPFSGCENLERVDLTNCSLNELRVGQLQDMKKLTHLYADYNSIRDVSSSLFFDLKELEVLSMRFNQLRSSTIAKEAFISNEHLAVLDLSNNDLEDLNFLDKATSNDLTQLVLDHNRIVDIRYINKFSNLEVLSASGNLLQSIPNVNGFHELQLVNLTNNDITVLNLNNFWTTSSPVTIDLSNNEIHTISRDDIDIWTNAVDTTWSVILHGNPLECTCREEWFKKETRYKVFNESLIRLYENFRYACPESHHNISHALDISDCLFIHRDALIVVGCLLLLLSCCAILALGMTLGKRIERRHRTNSGGAGRKKPEAKKELVGAKEVTHHDRRTDASPAFMIAEKDQHLKDAMSLSNLKGSMVRLDNENVKPFFREIYV